MSTEVKDHTIAVAVIGGAKLDHLVSPPPVMRKVDGLGMSLATLGLPPPVVQSLANEFAQVARILGMLMTREDALIRELVALRAELARVTAPPVELDLAALQTKTAVPESDRGPDGPPDEAA